VITILSAAVYPGSCQGWLPPFLQRPSPTFAIYAPLDFALLPLRRDNQQIIPKKNAIATISRG